MSKFGRWFWGVVLVLIGLIGVAHALGLVSFGIWSIVGVIWSWFWRLLVPIIILGCGIALICRADYNGAKAREVHEKAKKMRMKEIRGDDDDEPAEAEVTAEPGRNGEEYWSTFGEQEINFDGKEFVDCRLEAIFGSMQLDLRKAKMANESAVKVTTIFGSAKIFVPADVKVEVACKSAFGSCENKYTVSDAEKVKKTLYVDATTVFGGVEII